MAFVSDFEKHKIKQMKKLNLLFIGLLSMSTIYAQDITDALRYSQDNIQGSARFRALSGAFGALGGDMSAISLNPAGSAVFTTSNLSFTLSNSEINNNTQYFNGLTSTNDSNFNFNQAGAAFVFATNSNSPWKKFTLGLAYEKTNDFNDDWNAVGLNTNDDGNFSNSIASYFYDYADGVRLGDISLLANETISEAYRDIGNVFGFAHQQAFLGYQAYILEAQDENDDNNTLYDANVATGNFSHDYLTTSTGFNGKVSFNIASSI